VLLFFRNLISQALRYNQDCVAFCPIRHAKAGDFLDALLPLFPLDVVLFPGTPLPLHIFEPRYKEKR
jgi:hypothetical protein